MMENAFTLFNKLSLIVPQNFSFKRSPFTAIVLHSFYSVVRVNTADFAVFISHENEIQE